MLPQQALAEIRREAARRQCVLALLGDAAGQYAISRAVLRR